MDVINVEQAKIAEAAGAVAVMALERIPADIRFDGGVARMSDPEMIREIQAAVTIPVMAKVRTTLLKYFNDDQSKSQRANKTISHNFHRHALDTSLRHRSSNLLKSTTLTRVKCSQWPTRRTTSTKTTSKSHSYAAAETSARLFAALRKVQQCSERKARLEPETSSRQ
jgi:SOR/SNZ family